MYYLVLIFVRDDLEHYFQRCIIFVQTPCVTKFLSTNLVDQITGLFDQ